MEHLILSSWSSAKIETSEDLLTHPVNMQLEAGATIRLERMLVWNAVSPQAVIVCCDAVDAASVTVNSHQTSAFGVFLCSNKKGNVWDMDASCDFPIAVRQLSSICVRLENAQTGLPLKPMKGRKIKLLLHFVITGG